jgi:FKBP-type peptidyl-prolyl cis-trans isomerase 2
LATDESCRALALTARRGREPNFTLCRHRVSHRRWRSRPGIGYGRAVKIEHGRRVRLKVHLSVVGGDTLEKSVVEYIHGGGTMLPGLERVLQGLEAGAKKDGVLKAKDAFGNPSMHPAKKMKRGEFPQDAKLRLGERFMAKGPDGATDVVLAIEKLAGDDVEVRLVHPLAEKDLRYELEVLSVTDPKPPPLPARALKLDDA